MPSLPRILLLVCPSAGLSPRPNDRLSVGRSPTFASSARLRSPAAHARRVLRSRAGRPLRPVNALVPSVVPNTWSRPASLHTAQGSTRGRRGGRWVELLPVRPRRGGAPRSSLSRTTRDEDGHSASTGDCASKEHRRHPAAAPPIARVLLQELYSACSRRPARQRGARGRSPDLLVAVGVRLLEPREPGTFRDRSIEALATPRAASVEAVEVVAETPGEALPSRAAERLGLATGPEERAPSRRPSAPEPHLHGRGGEPAPQRHLRTPSTRGRSGRGPLDGATLAEV